MPEPKHKEHDVLKSLAGDWDCDMKMEAMPGVPGMEKPTECKGTERGELICNGLWLKTVINSTMQGEPFQGVWLAGYDPFKKKYVGIWVSSDEKEGCSCVFDGTYDEKTKSWTWTGKTPHGEMRSTLAWKDADTTVETGYMKTPDGKETKCMEVIRKRAKSAPTPADASAKIAKNLSKEQEVLQKEVGDWDATIKATHAPGQPPVEDKGTERVTAVCNGRWMWSDFKGAMAGMPFEGHVLYGWDPAEKKYVGFWIDSMSATHAKTAGTYDAAKKTVTLEGACVCPEGKPNQGDDHVEGRQHEGEPVRVQDRRPKVHHGDHLQAEGEGLIA
jgi:hypothetical protein